MNEKQKNILGVVTVAALLLVFSYVGYKMAQPLIEEGRAPEREDLSFKMTNTEESCLTQLDSVMELNRKLQYSYDSLALVCDPIKLIPEVVAPKIIKKKPKKQTIAPIITDTINNRIIDSLTAALAQCNTAKDVLYNGMVEFDKIVKDLSAENEELRKPRVSDLTNDAVKITTSAGIDSTLYNVSFTPDLDVDLKRIKRPFLSITPRKILAIAHERNPYATGKVIITEEFIKKDIPKVNGNHRIKLIK